MRPVAYYAALAAITVAIDQWIKTLVEANLVMQEQIDVLPFFALYRTYNTGVAFSMFSQAGDKILIALSVVVIALVLYLAAQTEKQRIIARCGFALIIGGALGNLIDRVSLGYVIDYFLFHLPTWSFAVFNMADVFISTGAAMVVFDEFLAWRRERKAAR